MESNCDSHTDESDAENIKEVTKLNLFKSQEAKLQKEIDLKKA